MSVFLTPDLKPFYGGTYFPPDDRYGRPGFQRVLLTHRRRPGRTAATRSTKQAGQTHRTPADARCARAGSRATSTRRLLRNGGRRT